MIEKRSKELTFTLVGHAHIDPVWLWDWREGYETVKATFRSALDRLRENPDMVFMHSSAAHYAWMADHPGMLAEIRDAVARGQWEVVGGWWVEPDANIPSGEALARQGLYGQRFFERVIGKRARVAFLPDTFGHPGTLPQLFRQAGMEYFAFMRPGANEIDLPNLFWWVGPDGSRVLTARVECYNTNPVYIDSSLERNLDWRPAHLQDWIGIYGVGNHGGGPTKKAIASIRRAAADPNFPTLRLGTLQSFFERVIGAAEHPTVQHELQHHARGCYSACSPIKLMNRRAEHALLSAEKFNTLATLHGHAYPAERLTHAWHQTLFNQFHDILAGSSIAPAYEDSTHELGEAMAIASRAQFSALQAITQQIDTRRDDREIEEPIRRTHWSFQSWTVDLGDGVPVVVFNPSPWVRREVIAVETNDWDGEMAVLDDQNQPVLHQSGQPDCVAGSRPRAVFVAEVPPLGYRLYRLSNEAPPEPRQTGLTVSAGGLENRWWRLAINPRTGALSSLFDKERGLELLAGPGAQPIAIADPTDTWGHGITSLRQTLGLFGSPTVEVVEQGPVRGRVAVTTAWGSSTIRQEFVLYGDLPQIEGRLTINWGEKQVALKLSFPFAIDQPVATFEVPYGHTVRPADGQEEPVQQWLDVTGLVRDGRGVAHPYGLAVLNDCKYGADVLGGEARITVLRSPVFAHHDPAKLKEGVAYAYQDQGISQMRWALVPHAGPWQDGCVVEAAHDLNVPMPYVREYAHDGPLPKRHSYVEITPPAALVLTALKRSEDGDDLILRLFEPRGRGAVATVEVPAVGARFAVHAGPNQVLTYRVSRSGQVSQVNFLEE